MNASESRTLLKRDAFGLVCRVNDNGPGSVAIAVERDTGEARWWLRPLARSLARREARALSTLKGIEGVPQLLYWDGRRLRRSWIDGRPMHQARPEDPGYFREALRLLRRLHAAGVVHNDLAKEPNWLVTANGRPALVDFQLAARPRHRGRAFRALAYDDLRHLLKHKRSYCASCLSDRQRSILARRSVIAAAWARTGKPVYRVITRRLLGWSDREGAGDRGQR
ncbi:MAG TPA: RIO1 family regulatory kinase/ATPase [Steroidobacteraceae bacterium]|nr:RIO1 family regulatory kinase/ATPase [Steroidobacteraceae bacterium]